MLHTFMCPWKNFACISLLSRGGYSALTWPSIQLTNHAFVSVSISHRNNHKIKVFWQSEKKYISSTCYPLTLPIWVSYNIYISFHMWMWWHMWDHACVNIRSDISIKFRGNNASDPNFSTSEATFGPNHHYAREYGSMQE